MSKYPACDSIAKPIIEVEDTEWHWRFRIVWGDLVGEWCGYAFIAQLDEYRAATEYYGDLFPVMKIFTVKEVE